MSFRIINFAFENHGHNVRVTVEAGSLTYERCFHIGTAHNTAHTLENIMRNVNAGQYADWERIPDHERELRRKWGIGGMEGRVR